MSTLPQQEIYKTTPQEPLCMHIFRPASNVDPTRSAIVFFFGGGWVNGNPEQFYPHCRHLAEQGMLAISAEYRIRSKHHTSPLACVADGKSALRWLRAKAAEFGIDPERIAAGGGSAGGHVAATTAIIQDFDEPDEDKTIPSTPNALVLFNPVLDTSERGFGADRIGPQALDISPIHHLRPALPPTLIFHGTDDQTVPIALVEEFTQTMQDQGNTCQLVPFEGYGHGFFNYKREDKAPYKQSIQMMDEFLRQVGFLGPLS